MKPTVILSTDTTPDYLFCLPIVVKSWKMQGFEAKIILRCNDHNEYADVVKLMFPYMYGAHVFNALVDEDIHIESPNKKLYVQCCRLYAACSVAQAEDYCILGDVDMFIASDFLARDFDKVNVFGHDLTGFQEVPMCYVGMKARTWLDVMGFDGMRKDLDKHSKYKSTVWHEAWGADQQILTAKLKEYGFDKINFISRGTDPENQNLPLGRWDRYGGFVRPKGLVHDVHLLRKPWEFPNFLKIAAMCKDIYPNGDWNWMNQYRNDFLEKILL